jgi:hypothetical protein
MNERQSDPTGAFSGGGAAGVHEAGTEFERHAPDGAQAGGGRPNDGRPATSREPGAAMDPLTEADGVDAAERARVTEGTAATSEIADPAAQADAERQGDGTPLPR